MNPNSPPGPTLTRGSPRSPIRPPRVGDHHVPVRRQVRGVAAGAAGSVESDPDREVVEDLAHDGLFDVEEFIPRLVVERCPPVVAFARRDGTRFDPLAQLLGRIQERLDFAEPGEGEVPVVHAGERPEQSYAFQAEEIRQRMLVDHGSVDAGILVDHAKKQSGSARPSATERWPKQHWRRHVWWPRVAAIWPDARWAED